MFDALCHFFYIVFIDALKVLSLVELLGRHCFLSLTFKEIYEVTYDSQSTKTRSARL